MSARIQTNIQIQPKINPIAVFKPLLWQITPWRDKSPIMLLTGSAGGGKSRLAAEKVHAYCKKYPGATGVALRKNRSIMTNSTVLFIDRTVIGEDPSVTHVPSKFRFEYANGSILSYAGMHDKDQRKHFRSIGQDGGVDIAWMEEGIEFESSDFDEVTPRMRGKAASWRQVILSTNPDSPLHFIHQKLMLGGLASVHFSQAVDNRYNPEDYQATLDRLTGTQRDRMRDGQWTESTGLVYGDEWKDGPGGNVTEEADYIPGAGPVVWWCDDGLVGEINEDGTYFKDGSHPRVILLVQIRNGIACVFEESYRIKLLHREHIAEVLALPYPRPDRAVVDKSASTFKLELHNSNIAFRNGAPIVEESITTLKGWLKPDINGIRRILVHPRCKKLRLEFVSFRRDPDGKIIKERDHGTDAVRYGVWPERFGNI